MLVSLTIPSDLSTPDTSKNGMNIIKILDIFWKKKPGEWTITEYGQDKKTNRARQKNKR